MYLLSNLENELNNYGNTKDQRTFGWRLGTYGRRASQSPTLNYGRAINI